MMHYDDMTYSSIINDDCNKLDIKRILATVIIAAMTLASLSSKTLHGADIAVSAQIGFVLGWFSHMVADTFNYPGTPWLRAVVNKHFNIMHVNSGIGEETSFMDIAIAVFAISYVLIINIV